MADNKPDWLVRFNATCDQFYELCENLRAEHERWKQDHQGPSISWDDVLEILKKRSDEISNTGQAVTKLPEYFDDESDRQNLRESRICVCCPRCGFDEPLGMAYPFDRCTLCYLEDERCGAGRNSE